MNKNAKLMNYYTNGCNNKLDNNIFPTKSVVTINIGNNGSQIIARVIRGICYLYIDMECVKLFL